MLAREGGFLREWLATEKECQVERTNSESSATNLYEIHSRGQKTIDDIRTVSAECFDEAFEAPELANVSLHTFQQKVAKLIKQDASMSTVLFTISGDGVLRPNYKTIQNDNSTTFFHGEDGPMLPLGLDEVRAYFAGINITTSTDEDDGYKVEPYLVMNSPSKMIAVKSEVGFSPLEITSTERNLVKCISDAEVFSSLLERVRSRQEAVEKLALQGITKTQYLTALNKLQGAMRLENISDFVPLKKVSYLHQIGKLGRAHSEKGEVQRETVLSSIGETIGRGRPIRVDSREIYKFDESGTIIRPDSKLLTGKLVDVCDALVGVDQRSIFMVVEAAASTGETPELHYIPMTTITDFEF